MHKLLEFATPACAAEIKSKAEEAIKISMCNYNFRSTSASDRAVGTLITVIDDLAPASDLEDLVPPFMITASAREFSSKLRLYILDKVTSRQVRQLHAVPL